MADTKISALPAATTPLAGSEQLPIVQGGETRRVSASSIGLVPHPGYAINRTYPAVPFMTVQSGQTITANVQIFQPLYVARTATISLLSLVVNTAQGGGAQYRLGIYGSDAANKPSNVLWSGLSFSNYAATHQVQVAGGLTLSPGVYWICSLFQESTGTFAVPGPDNSLDWLLGFDGTNAIKGYSQSVGHQVNTPFANAMFLQALPATYGYTAPAFRWAVG